MAKKKPLLVYPTFHKTGGIERFLSDLLSQLQVLKFDFSIGYSKYSLDQPTPKLAVHIPCISKPTFLKTLLFALLSRLYISPKKYFIHTQGANFLSPHLITAHSCHKAWFLESLRTLRPFSLAWFKKILNPIHYISIAIETWQYKYSGVLQVVCVSHIVREQLQLYYGMNEDRLSVVHNGVNLDEFFPNEIEKQDLRSRLEIKGDEKILLFVANEFKRKNLSVVIDALKNLPLNFRLFVVGQNDFSAFRTQAKSLGMNEEKVKFFGPKKNLREFYQAADVFVLPTQHDAFALVVLEAMACGLPAVTTRQAGVSEIMTHQKDGLIMEDPFDSAELCKNILYAIENQQNLGSEAILTSKLNSSLTCAQKMVDIYDKFNK